MGTVSASSRLWSSAKTATSLWSVRYESRSSMRTEPSGQDERASVRWLHVQNRQDDQSEQERGDGRAHQKELYEAQAPFVLALDARVQVPVAFPLHPFDLLVLSPLALDACVGFPHPLGA